MELNAVADAVWLLESRGEKASVRAVCRLTGGSFRDVSRLLRQWREDKPAPAESTPGPAAPAPSSRSETLIFLEQQLREIAEELPALRARRPPDVRAAEQAAHDARVHDLQLKAHSLRLLWSRLQAEAAAEPQEQA